MPGRHLRLLILGGTRFLGRFLVDQALARGHQVTLVNRGISDPDSFPEVERIVLDRAKDDWELPAGRCWDAAIDVPTDQPDWVRRAVVALGDRVGHYTYVSSISAYADLSLPGACEDAPLAECPPEELLDPPHYGARKAVCEGICQQAFADRCLIVRPGLLVGPHDPSDRFTYWPTRLSSPEPALAPGDGRTPAQFLDARDLAAWMLRAIERGLSGVFHAAGPPEPLTLAELLTACAEVTGVETPLRWISEEAMTRFGIRPWIDLPVFVPAVLRGMSAVDLRRILEAGLVCRPIQETIRDTWEWDRARDPNLPRVAGLDRELERQVLGSWRG